ncbi:unnamed protein product, partial [Ilex paraguariensis]
PRVVIEIWKKLGSVGTYGSSAIAVAGSCEASAIDWIGVNLLWSVDSCVLAMAIS